MALNDKESFLLQITEHSGYTLSDFLVKAVLAIDDLSMGCCLKEHIRQNLVVDFFREPLDLAVKVVISIGHHLIHHPDFFVIQPKDATESRRRDELITLLKTRKELVLSVLSSSKSRARFLELHAKNIIGSAAHCARVVHR